jgi:hypothetical protein
MSEPIIEPVFCPDILATKLHRVDRFGGLARLIFVVPITEDGQQFQQVVAKLVVPIASLPLIQRVIDYQGSGSSDIDDSKYIRADKGAGLVN